MAAFLLESKIYLKVLDHGSYILRRLQNFEKIAHLAFDRLYLTPVPTDYGHPERAFFINLELLGLDRHFGLKYFVAFGVFSA